MSEVHRHAEFYTGADADATDPVELVGIALPSDEGAVTGGTAETPVHTRIRGETADGASTVALQASAAGELHVADGAQRRLEETLFLQSRDAALAALRSRERERVTFTDRRGSDGQRGR